MKRVTLVLFCLLVSVAELATAQELTRGSWLLRALHEHGCASDWFWQAMQDNSLTELTLERAIPRDQIKIPGGCQNPAPTEIAAQSRFLISRYQRGEPQPARRTAPAPRPKESGIKPVAPKPTVVPKPQPSPELVLLHQEVEKHKEQEKKLAAQLASAQSKLDRLSGVESQLADARRELAQVRSESKGSVLRKEIGARKANEQQLTAQLAVAQSKLDRLSGVETQLVRAGRELTAARRETAQKVRPWKIGLWSALGGVVLLLLLVLQLKQQIRKQERFDNPLLVTLEGVDYRLPMVKRYACRYCDKAMAPEETKEHLLAVHPDTLGIKRSSMDLFAKDKEENTT